MKRLLIAAALVGLSGAAFAQNPAPYSPAEPPGVSGYVFPNVVEEPFAPTTVVEQPEPPPLTHVFLFPPSDTTAEATN